MGDSSNSGAEKMEIEKKFLLAKDFDISTLEGAVPEEKIKAIEIEQSYLRYAKKKVDEAGNVIQKQENERIRRYGDQYFRTVKKGEGAARLEREWEISKEEYDKELANIVGHTIRKVRYRIEDENYPEIIIDKYHDFPLTVAEVEFYDLKQYEQFQGVDWLTPYVLEDVTEKDEYGNGYIALNGFNVPN